MSHFSFESSLSEVIRLDAPIENVPLLRWQRKTADHRTKAMSLEGELRALKTTSSNGGQKTPVRSPCVERFICKSKSPVAKLKACNKTPGKQAVGNVGEKVHGLMSGQKQNRSARTPNKTPLGDRFIPCRSSMDMEAGHFRVISTADAEESSAVVVETEYQRHLSEALGANQNTKILSFIEKAPATKEGTARNIPVLYSGTAKGRNAACTRIIPQQPERILDAPELLDDYYLNLLSWSNVNNHVATALGASVYLWNASTGSIVELCELTEANDYVSCVSWLPDDNILAVGNSRGVVQIWDVNQEHLVRSMAGHASRVGALSWNSYILSSGSRGGALHHHDVRVASHHVGTLVGHTQEICGLQWSNDGHHLASGANDNLLCVWDRSVTGHAVTPVHVFNQHMSAVKAIAWCPWQSNLLASGGGTADRQIKFWNVSSGACLQSVETNSQVCAILWSTHYHELISGHGYSRNQLSLWKYPTMTKFADMTGHTARVLSLAMSPDGTAVASAAADETIRFWRCFDVDKQHSKTTAAGKIQSKDSASIRQFGSLSLVR